MLNGSSEQEECEEREKKVSNQLQNEKYMLGMTTKRIVRLDQKEFKKYYDRLGSFSPFVSFFRVFEKFCVFEDLKLMETQSFFV